MRESDFLPLVDLALREDLGNLGDVTSRAVVPDEACALRLTSKDEGVLAGERVFAAVFTRVDPDARVTFLFHDGAPLRRGDIVAKVEGPAHSLLGAERTAINFLGFLSGIATAARRFASAAAASGRAVILDTRKTLPGFRALSKYAVTVGGGKNHRQGLYDMILIKDNHIDAAGSIRTAVERARRMWGDRFEVEVECRGRAEVEEALACGADMIMLDNMGLEETREAVRLIGKRAKVEASGNMTEEKAAAASAAGVDFISVGMITHSVRCFDFSLTVEKEKGA